MKTQLPAAEEPSTAPETSATQEVGGSELRRAPTGDRPARNRRHQGARAAFQYDVLGVKDPYDL